MGCLSNLSNHRKDLLNNPTKTFIHFSDYSDTTNFRNVYMGTSINPQPFFRCEKVTLHNKYLFSLLIHLVVNINHID